MNRRPTFRDAVAVLAVGAAVAAGAAGPLAASGERSSLQHLASPGQPWPEPYEDDPPSPPGDENDPPRPVQPGCPNCFI